MTKSDSLIQLVSNLTKQERKELSVWFNRQPDSDYHKLYTILDKHRVADSAELKTRFLNRASGDSFNSAVSYLFDLLLRRLAEMRRDADSYHMLLNKLLHARVLFEKSLHAECYDLLEETKRLSRHYNNHFTLMLAQRMEIEFRLMSDFRDLTEKQILDNHSQINRTINFIAKFNEQTSLYELIRYRMLRYGYARTDADAKFLDDLVSSELHVISSMRTRNDFEIQKNHKLFQAYYFIMCGHYTSAVRAFKELHELFEENRHLWNNPPVYYLSTVAGMLESLRTIRDYDGMDFFIEKLRLLKSKSTRFLLSVRHVIFINTLYPMIDRGDFATAQKFIDDDTDEVVRHADLLPVNAQAEIALYSALTLMCNGRLKEARHKLRPQLNSIHRINNRMLSTTIRLVNTIIYFERGDTEFVMSQYRSILREINRNKGGKDKHRFEIFLLRFMVHFNAPTSQKDRDAMWESSRHAISSLSDTGFESQVLRCFDFTLWIKAKIYGRPVAEIFAREAIIRKQRELSIN